MIRWRGIFDRMLLYGAVLMAALSIVVIVSAIRTAQETSQNFNDNLTFYAGQMEVEALLLQDALSRSAVNDPSLEPGAVTLRFDILWSRVFNELDPEVFWTDETTYELAMQTLQSSREALQEVEAPVAALQPLDVAGAVAIKNRIRPIVFEARALHLASKDSRVRNQTTLVRHQLAQTNLVFGLIVGMALFGVCSILLLRADRREIQSMNARLEDRVRQRTDDLQSANRRLAGEIAERQRSQDLAEERETRLEQAVQLARLGYYVWDSIEDRCELCSGQHAAAYGMTPTQFIAAADGRAAALELIHPDDRTKVAEKYQELCDGHIIEVSYRVKTSSGTRRLREVARPIFDDVGNVIRVSGSTLDVTDQYETELKLFEAQKMDSIGKMTGGVAHDFNNLLAVILGNLELLQEAPTDEERDEMFQDAINATLRGRDLTMSMLSFARRAPLDPSDLQLNEIVAEMHGMLRRTLPESISLEVVLSDDLSTVVADRSLTESTLLNLAINARDAMPDGGRLTIETSNVTLSNDQIDAAGEEIEPGEYVMLAVTDTGRGIQKELMANIFEPFFTTKEFSKNSGLGLSMVQGFMRQTGGTVRVYSEPGVGTTFKLLFQAAVAQDAVAEPAEMPDVATPPASLRVLLVEDDDTVRKILTRQLEISGMCVVPAAESAAAEHAYQTDGPFDVVVSDIVMPGDLQGPSLLRRLRETDKDLPGVLLSGYPQEAIMHGNGVSPEDVMVMKPVGREDLIAAINLALNPGSAPSPKRS
ncbi:diguanylate cyclase/phosphodiesterase (GGDEF & EAL domains) with PAS/PAC sensor(s) [Candidatus Rhodobacter oscarellae]|uniref:histidine kinase n=1 Tax=Candidatus Rhodobacter oscarellae TaxID=1675527 RepID=A0A0J9H088_9RHOB|nr:PAS domain-containing hybrid sensor histidine kinase/response regulator [Candidatus Rhodobacter lobularis]KMW59148.1 diguanylate cyclase/phosphodiesterase (GGDEF & EAL domains) with PAS/PAC sensor(s) [Candidatus Rhodobacter lobularis]